MVKTTDKQYFDQQIRWATHILLSNYTTERDEEDEEKVFGNSLKWLCDKFKHFL